MVYKLSLEELPVYLSQGAVLVDVREKSEYDVGHLSGSINIPYQKVLEYAKNYPKDTIWILYCSTGKRSKIAAALLVSMGFSKVYDMGKVVL